VTIVPMWTSNSCHAAKHRTMGAACGAKSAPSFMHLINHSWY